MGRKYQHWRESRHSRPNGECVEVARAADGTTGIRDSKANASGVLLEFTPAEWARLLTWLRNA